MRNRHYGFIATLWIAVSALWAQDPNVARGIAPGNVYRNFDIDTINQFNGNLVIRIPIGDAFPVGPLLSQSLALVYNSKIYDYEMEQYRNYPDDTLYKNKAIPEQFSNAGFGWTLSLGRLMPPSIEDLDRGWFYRGPDGSEHDLTEGPGDPAEAQTHDGSFLRLKRYPSNPSLPVAHREIEFPDGTVHKFSPAGDLDEIRDRFGHSILVDDSDSMKWVITNRYGTKIMRTTTVNFETRTAPAGYSYPPNFQKVVSSVELPAFGTATPATYEFGYTDAVLPRDGCGDPVNYELPDFGAPLLTEILFPDGSTYIPSYQTTIMQTCTAGIVNKMTLPTGGSIQWTHQAYKLSQAECDDAHGWVVTSPGVHKRILRDAQDNQIGEWTYEPSIDLNPGAFVACGEFDGWNLPHGPAPTEAITTVSASEMRNGSLTPVGGETIHYFSATLNAVRANALGYDVKEYGLPFTRRVSHSSNGNRFLSARRYEEAGTLLRSTYLTYKADAVAFDAKLSNARVQGELTVFDADTGCGGVACRVDVDRPETDYDQYGHYRKSVTSSNFGPTRTVFTNFTPNATGWVLGTYDSSWIEEGGVASKQLVTFDGNGVMKSRRTLVGTGATAGVIATHPTKDLLEVFCRDGRGFLQSEKFFGGDGAGAAIPGDDPCSATPAATEYQIDHTITFDSVTGAPTKHTAKYTGMAFSILDQDLDVNTGRVSVSRDVSGVETTYGFDEDTQPVQATVTPAGLPWTLYEYSKASASAPATLRVTTRAAGAAPTATPLTDAFVYYDWLGRPIQEKRKIPSDAGGRWSTSKLGYDFFNRKTNVSVPEFRDTSAYEPTFAPAESTVTTYDVFGRPVSVVTPDDKSTSVSYTGGGKRKVERTVQVGLTTGPANVTTTQTMDAYGRLVSVTEPNATNTRYKYDLAGRLFEVCQHTTDGGLTCGQKRTFTYDNRGYLTSESHPENGTTSYTYDARGHALTKAVAGAPSSEANLQFTYDAAERLTHIKTYHPPQSTYRPGKVFSFGYANEGTNKKLGKLVSATRYNYNVGELVVKESYDYVDTAGRLSKTTTEIKKDEATLQTLEQSQSYESGGNIGTLTYPTCLTVPCGAATWNNSTLTYTNAFLTKVSLFANSITYTAAGVVSQIDHYGPVTDTYTPDETGVRPKSITFSGHTSCIGPVIQAGSPPDQSVGSGQTATLTVSATNAGGYQWYEADGTKLSGQTGASYTTPVLTSVRSYYVEVYNDCQTVRSRTATVNSCPALSITSGTPQDQSVLPEQTATLTISASGATAYQWYESNGTLISGQTSSTFTTPPLVSTKSYYVIASNACNTVQSRTATVTVATLSAPTGLQATASGTSAVSISWNSSANAHHYVLERKANGSSYQSVQSVYGISTNDSPVTAGKTYVYRVRAVSQNELVSSSPSNADLATTIVFTPIVAGQTGFASNLFNELLATVNALRVAQGSPTTTWSSILPANVPAPAPGVPMLAQQLISLRSAMNAARMDLGFAPLGYTDPAPTNVPISVVHVTEIRGGAQ